MDEVTGAVIAIAFGLSAVFVPTAFIAGISGQFYRQFALTIAVSTLISAFELARRSRRRCARSCCSRTGRTDWFGRIVGLRASAGSSASSIAASTSPSMRYARRRLARPPGIASR